MTWLRASEAHVATMQPAVAPNTGELLMEEAHGLRGSMLQSDHCLVREEEPRLLVVPFARSSLHSFQSASLDCQLLSRQGLDRGLSQDSAVLSRNAQRIRHGWLQCQSPAQICRKLLISVSNCWRRRELAACQLGVGRGQHSLFLSPPHQEYSMFAGLVVISIILSGR